MDKVCGYLANQLGFSETGRYVLDNLIVPRIEQIGITVLDPFKECEKFLDTDRIEAQRLYEQKRELWKQFNERVGPNNNALMQRSKVLLAILDGGHTIDDGVASEIGYFAGINHGPILALRSDFRGGENLATTINPQVLGYIRQSKGELIDGGNALERWFKKIEQWYKILKNN